VPVSAPRRSTKIAPKSRTALGYSANKDAELAYVSDSGCDRFSAALRHFYNGVS
jgi:hypothetical protein